MLAKDLLTYQFGNLEAVRRVAGSRYLLVVSATLVLITSVPRNYDQTYIGEVPWWPVIPLAFSFISGSFVFWVLYRGFIKEAGDGFRRKYWMFIGLFWMTAPVAWLYGIPVERFMDVRGAAVSNLWLLCVVSVWRVALLARVMSVIYQVSSLLSVGWVLLAAALEVAFLLFFRGIGEGIGRGMAGMRNSPEQDLILRILGAVFWASVIVVPVLLILLRSMVKVSEKAQITELPGNNRLPWLLLLACSVVWIGLAVQPQRELAREWKYRALLKKWETRDALAYLDTLDLEDWPSAKPFRPDPYEFEVWDLLPPLMEQVTGNEKPWVQQKFLWVFERTFDHRYRRFSEEDYLKILSGIAKFERGEDWIRGSAEKWNRNFTVSRRGWTNLATYLEAKGVKLIEEQKQR
jgi:hypothetical protein